MSKPSLEEVLKDVKDYLKLGKDLSQLLDGSGSFINCYNKNTHRIHGKVDTIGATTSRMTHNSPNITQLTKDKEFRELLCADKDKTLIGCDAGSLELCILGHYLGPYDDYEFAKAVDSGDKSKGTDVHTMNQKRAGLPTRDAAKTLIFATIYGAGNTKLGDMVWDRKPFNYTKQEYTQAKEAVAKRLIYINSKPYFPLEKSTLVPYDEQVILYTMYGTRISTMFKDNTKGYHQLAKWALDSVKNNHIKALDGRELYLRSEHKALNLYIQSGGAIYMKYLLCNIDNALRAKYKYGKQWGYVANIHDDIELECDKDIAEDIAKILSQTFIDTAYQLGMKYPIYGEPAIGQNQWEIH